MTKKEENRRLRKQLARLTARNNELHELVGVERGRADALRQEADFWKRQVVLWQQKATAAANEALRLRRKTPGDLRPVQKPLAVAVDGSASKESTAADENRQKNVFISQPMRGKTDEEILAERDRIRAQLQYDFGDFIELQTYKQENKGKAPLEALGDGIKLMAQADIVVFAPGWDDNRGCMIEHLCAELYGKRIRYISSKR